MLVLHLPFAANRIDEEPQYVAFWSILSLLLLEISWCIYFCVCIFVCDRYDMYMHERVYDRYDLYMHESVYDRYDMYIHERVYDRYA